MNNIPIFSHTHGHGTDLSRQPRHRALELLEDVGKGLFLVRYWELLLSLLFKEKVLIGWECFTNLRMNYTVCEVYFRISH